MKLDRIAFDELLATHRREIHVHCYRMLGSFDEAEDLVQETFLRAWRSRDSFDGEHFRAWLYKIATNACLDARRRGSRRLTSLRSFAEIPWIQPYPDRLLDEMAPAGEEPDAVVVARETIELGFLAVIQLLPPRQRAVLILREVLGWPAAETAETLGLSVPATNSALQRARATLKDRLPDRLELTADRLELTANRDASPARPSAEERELLDRLIEAHNRSDSRAMAAVMREDVRITMPPLPLCFDGLEEIEPLFERAFHSDEHGEWRLMPIAANRLPAAASYHRAPGSAEFRAYKIDVLRIVDGAIAEVTNFDAKNFPFARFGLPETL